MKNLILIVAIALTVFGNQASASERYNDWGAWATTTPPVALSAAATMQAK